MSQEKVREIFSHVDMSKIDLSSFKLSEKKFNEMATLYKNRVILSCVSIIASKEDDHEAKNQAFQVIEKIAENPDIYRYATLYAAERKAVDAAIDDITTRRDRNINDIKLKAIEKRMKDAYKQMRKTIEMAMENGVSFEHEFDDVIVERCLKIAKDAIDDGKRKAAEPQEATVVKTETQSEQKDATVGTEAVVEPAGETKPNKISFWKRIFGRA